MSVPRNQANQNLIKNVLWLVASFLLLFVLLRTFEYAQVYKPRTDLIAHPGSIHPEPLDVVLESGDSYRLHGWFFSATEQNEWSDWVVLISHGNGGNISYGLPLCRVWLEEGFNVMAYDYRGYGQSSGRPSEQGTYEDVTQFYQWLLSRGFDPKRIIAVGESLGGAVATDLATRKTLGGLVIQNSFTRITDIGKELFPWLPIETFGTIRYDTQSKLPGLQLPKMILHSREDSLVAFHHAEKNFADSREPKYLGETEGDHNDGVAAIERLYRHHVNEFKKLLREFHSTPNQPALEQGESK